MRILKVCADARYTEDADILNPETGVFEEDKEAKMPCLKGSCWCPEINPDTCGAPELNTSEDFLAPEDIPPCMRG